MKIEQPAFPLTLPAFDSAIRKGQGRVLQHLGIHGCAGLENLVIDHCLHCHSYDPQCEAARAPWLFAVVECAGLKPEVTQAIGAIVHVPPQQEHRDLVQRSALLREFAFAGSADARQLLYLSLVRVSGTASVIADADIVALDGVDGLRRVAKQQGRWLREDSGFWVNDLLVEEVDALMGAPFGLLALESAAATDPDIAHYLNGLRQTREHAGAGLPNLSKKAFTGAQIVAYAQQVTNSKCRWFRQWGMEAGVDQREVVFSALLAQNAPVVAERLLRCFGKTGVPRFDRALLTWLYCEDEQVRWAAVQAVSQLGHHELRKAALQLIADGDLANGLRLLVANFEEGDFSMCASMLEQSSDEEHHHSLGSRLLELCTAHPRVDALDCLIYVYEFSPCSSCRRRAVGGMIAMEVAPDWILKEAALDSDPETQALASKALASAR